MTFRAPLLYHMFCLSCQNSMPYYVCTPKDSNLFGVLLYILFSS